MIILIIYNYQYKFTYLQCILSLCTSTFTDYETKLFCLTDALMMACSGEQSSVYITFHMCSVEA